MGKLIAAFEKNPNKATAGRLVRYVRSHPMCVCMMTREDSDVYKLALDVCNGKDTFNAGNWFTLNR